jgi:hypothetical protein
MSEFCACKQLIIATLLVSDWPQDHGFGCCVDLDESYFTLIGEAPSNEHMHQQGVLLRFIGYSVPCDELS